MKKFAYLACFIAMGLMPAAAQPTVTFTGTPPPTFSQRVAQIMQQQSNQAEPKLTTFNLDFPGGPPAELVAAIEKATGKPLNAIIPMEDTDIILPPLKMDDVNVPQLFVALEAASSRTVETRWSVNYSTTQSSYGFKTADPHPSDTSIWYFYVYRPPTAVLSECHFYQLQSYLERGFTVDDITTAIQTGWKMAGVSPLPELNYHKETKLLIAFGKPDDLATIQNVLDTLPSSNASSTEIEKLQSIVASLQGQVNRLDKKVSSENSGK